MNGIPALTKVQIYPTRIPEIKRDPLGFLLRQQQAHGDFIHYPLRIIDVYQVTDPAIIQHVLQTNNRNYTKDTIQYNTLSQVTGRGLLTSDGRFWLKQRRLVQPAFHRQRLAAMGNTMTSIICAQLERWDALARSGEPLDVDAAMMQTTLEIVGKTLFNLDLHSEAHAMVSAVLETLDYVVYRANAFLAPPLSWPTPRNRRVRAALDQLDRIIYATIDARRESSVDYGDVLTILLQARDEDSGRQMPDAQIRDEMMTLLVAGHETVASALTWSWYLLARHPHVRQALEAEVDSVLAGRMPVVSDLQRLPFTRAVFEETLRLYPPAWLITRRASERDAIGGAEIPPNALMIMSPYVTHRHPGLWPDPLNFDPSRFLGSCGADQPRFAYISFGGGPRLCIGDQFAMLEAQLILAAVTQRFRLNLASSRPVEVEALVTLRPRDGLWMTLEPR